MNDGAMTLYQGGALTAANLRSQVQLIQEVMKGVMKEDVHYGKIPGTDKPSLLKAGAEKLCMVFHLGPDYDIVDKDRDGDHLTITSKCTLTHIPTGMKVGSALGSCSTMESKYAYRKGVRKCPECGAEAIIKGKAEYGGGWVCFAKKGGCNTKYPDDDDGIPKVTPTGEAAQQEAAGKKKPPAEPKAKAKDKPAAVQTPGAINETQIRILRRKVDDPGQELLLVKHFGVEKIGDIPAAKINDAIEFVEKGDA